VVVGGGFGGLNVARQLRKAPVQLTLVDRRNFHLFQPLLYQVATGGLSPANIAAPLRDLLKRQTNCEVLLGEVDHVDVANRRVILREGELPYDTLVVATGVRHQYFGRDDWEPMAPGLKTIEDATSMRRRVLTAFEAAERETDPAAVRAWLTFVIVGGGPTGVELAGTLCELARETLRGNFRRINPADAEVIVVEAADRVLQSFPESLSAKALASLEKLGVVVRTKTRLTDVQPHQVTVQCGQQTETIAARTILWAAGVAASPLGKILADATEAQVDRAGRVIVNSDCTIPGHPELLVIGDLAHFNTPDGGSLPGVAQTAIQQGRYVGKLIAARLKGQTLPPFHYKDLGNLATIGRHAAVAEIGKWKLSGWFAWWIWVFIHLMKIVQFQNRILVMVQWAWMYWTRNRSARLITGAETDEERSPMPAAAAENDRRI
jgi:NADH dehydrogenase